MKKVHKISLLLVLPVAVAASFLIGMRTEKILHPTVTNYVVEANDQDKGKAAVIDFLESLYEKNYSEAVAVFGGEYWELRYWNPVLDPNDLAALWKNGCEQNGLQCLEVRNVSFASQPDPNTINYKVWFNNPDKITEFVHPKSGASVFTFTVKRIKGKLLVTTPPVYLE